MERGGEGKNGRARESDGKGEQRGRKGEGNEEGKRKRIEERSGMR